MRSERALAAVIAVLVAALAACNSGQQCLRNSDCPPPATCSAAGVCGDGTLVSDAGLDADAADADADAADAEADAADAEADAAGDAAADAPDDAAIDARLPSIEDPATAPSPPIVVDHPDAAPVPDAATSLDDPGAVSAPPVIAARDADAAPDAP